MKKSIPKTYLPLLILVFLFGVVIRLINFKESVYFGYDEARDAFISQEIFTQGDLKIIGPQASAFPGIHHGPFYYYLIGPLFLIADGNPYFVSIIFRLANALGIFGIYVVGSLLFTPLTGLISALIYAFSYEQFIYAIFTGNPSISNISWLLMFMGLGIVLKYKDKSKLGVLLMALGASIIPQFDMIGGYSLIVLLILLFLIKKRLKNINFKDWLWISFIGLSPLYTYIFAEIKNKFLATQTLINLIKSNISIVASGDSVGNIIYRNILGIFRNNIIDFDMPENLVALLFATVVIYLIVQVLHPNWKFALPFLRLPAQVGKKESVSIKFFAIITWIFCILFLYFARGFMPFYSYAGVGAGLIIAVAIVVAVIFRINKLTAILILGIIMCSNLIKTIDQSSKSLIVEIKAQPGMKLSDEITLINKTYEHANGEAFTIRVTSMPYRIQTVWAYLYKKYGYEKYGYYPYLETGNVLGFPGELPIPKAGVSCVRYLIREPIRGIPENLIIKDVNEENDFSTIEREEKIGDFVLQYRKAKGVGCHNNKP